MHRVRENKEAESKWITLVWGSHYNPALNPQKDQPRGVKRVQINGSHPQTCICLGLRTSLMSFRMIRIWSSWTLLLTLRYFAEGGFCQGRKDFVFMIIVGYRSKTYGDSLGWPSRFVHVIACHRMSSQNRIVSCFSYHKYMFTAPHILTHSFCHCSSLISWKSLKGILIEG